MDRESNEFRGILIIEKNNIIMQLDWFSLTVVSTVLQILTSTLAAVFAFLSWRWMTLQSESERQGVLRDQVGGGGRSTDVFRHSTTNIRVNEDDSLRYRITKILFGHFSGRTTVTIQFSSRGTPPDESDIEKSAHLSEGSEIWNELGIVSLRYIQHEAPESSLISSLNFSLEDDYGIDQSHREVRGISVRFDTAEISEVEERIALLVAVVEDTVSEGKYDANEILGALQDE